ncbi:diphthine--ammonia ligase isoform X1 [Prosopis cineraria]|uniref:diphthine--ammonia ligase isoform X1 n=2 Tax=Prosopis cineraria TaxID=364024 RepID=UPI00240EC747|nr:diphthine--ammonia ligase isoform X1 [Prosopis cineraria]
MKVVALISGGKDSCYAMMMCIKYGHEIVALANLMPDDGSVDELDSYMYQTVGHQIVISYAECMGLPLFRRQIKGSTRHQELGYRPTPGDEVEDMFILLSEVKRQIPSVTAVSSGAIASDYQRLRVESVCSRLGLVSLAYLWKQDQSLLLQEMIANGIVAVTVKVAAMGLDPGKHLGKEITLLNSHLHKLKELYGINVCGEGGEYETLTLDCPLFINARIMLDEYQVVMHSSDSIAPVGILHPLAFHLENKADAQPLRSQDNEHEMEKPGNVFEVHDCPERCEVSCKPADCVTGRSNGSKYKFQFSRTKNKSTFSMCCWLQDSCSGLQEDLEAVLGRIESQLGSFGFGWENILYVHLYIDDMNQFSVANDTYMKFITHENCCFGVPSRSTVEMPLLQVGLGRALVDVLVTRDVTKKVLHVQSISCWAPSCIGPYSQATLHEGILHMAGQLGLDPPTMNLCSGGPGAELEQALRNSEAVAKCFKCSILTSVITFVIYCSKRVSSLERREIMEKQETFLREMKISPPREGNMNKGLDPIFLYVLVPDLPKRACVEVKPILYVEDDTEATIENVSEGSRLNTESYWGFKHERWHDSCIQKCVVHGKICALVLSITSELAVKICSKSLPIDNVNDGQFSVSKANMEKISKFLIYLLDKAMTDSAFAWEDITNLRFYIPSSLEVPMEELTAFFNNALSELAKINHKVIIVSGEEPMFNIVPVIGAGRFASSMDDVVTCELLARRKS